VAGVAAAIAAIVAAFFLLRRKPSVQEAEVPVEEHEDEGLDQQFSPEDDAKYVSEYGLSDGPPEAEKAD
jgi:hypothetical protein